jgi:tetratricopeptide (TPR) repeat protein
MLLDQSRLAEAHDAYKLALVRTPGRYNSIYGAGKTAFEMGDTEVAQQYFNMLLKNTEGAVSSRPSLDEVRRLIAAI